MLKLFPFNEKGLDLLKYDDFGHNWPVVYLLENTKELYVGETVDAVQRTKNHLQNLKRRYLERLYLVCDDEFHKSAALDIESSLIQYFAADGKYTLQNGNKGLQNHEYYDRPRYKAKFELLWEELIAEGIAQHTLSDLRNSDLFKYSPYKALTAEQLNIAEEIAKKISTQGTWRSIVQGAPGTGKTILAVYLMKYLVEELKEQSVTIGLVVPMTSLRKTLKNVFKHVSGLKPSMVLGPSEVVSKHFDILIVDEAHRLRQRKNITNYATFDKNNRALDLDKSGTELDWVLRASKHAIFMYDPNQSVRPSDISAKHFKRLNAYQFRLTEQMRVEGGEEYVEYINALFENQTRPTFRFNPNYDFQIFDSMKPFIEAIQKRDKEFGLSRLVAGYAWEWISKHTPHEFDIKIDGTNLRWNSTVQDWVNSDNAINEVGCIHTVQGYDLNYVGVIIGPELAYDRENKKFVIHKEKYKDRNGHAGVTDPKELEYYILNIYKTLLTRGIKGVYIYIVDPELRKYFQTFFK